MEEIILSKSDFEEVNCLNCNSIQYENFDRIEWKGQELQYRICKNCSLKYMSPRPLQSWYHKYYKEGFWQELLQLNAYQDKGNKFHFKDKKQILNQKVLNNKRRANRINLIVKPLIANRKKLKILEIGAGFGQTLLLFKKKYNAEIAAIEPNEETRSYLKSAGIKLVGTYAEELSSLPEDEKFDLIITSHVLENLSYPLDVLKMISNHLYDDGLYFVDTTNMYYRNDANPYHMLIYTPESAKNMLNRAGFHPLRMHYEDFPDTIKHTKQPNDLDPYLSIISRKGKVKEEEITVDVDAIKNKQQLGEKFFIASQEKGLILHNRLDRRIISKLRRIFNIPVPVVLSKEQYFRS